MGRLDLLHAEDLKPGREVVLVEHLGRFARSVTRQAAASGRLTVFMRGIHGVRKTAWFQDAVERDHLREFSFHPFQAFDEFWRADDKAFDVVESVYALLKREGRVPATPLVDLYQDKEVDLAFKKVIAVRLREFYQAAAAMRLALVRAMTSSRVRSERTKSS